MAPTIARFQFDRTGRDRDNFVPGEVHSIGTHARRIIAPKYGAFFAKGVVLQDLFTNKELVHGTHYLFDSSRTDVVGITGQGVYGLIVVTDPTVSDMVSLDYQAVGSPYDTHLPDAVRMAQILAGDTRTVSVNDVSGIPDAFTPSKHFQNLADFSNFDTQAHAVERLRMLHNLRARIQGDVIYGYADNALTDLSKNGAATMAQLMADHLADGHAHDQYVLRSEIDKYILPIRKPKNLLPAAGQIDVNLDVTMQLSKYLSLYRKPLSVARFQVSTAADFSGTPVLDISVPSDTYHYTDVLGSAKLYYWRGQFVDIDGSTSEWTDGTAFTTRAVSISQPVFLAPTGGTATNSETPTLSSSAFAITGDADAHQSSDWEVWTGPNGTGTLLWSKVGDTVNKTSIAMPLATLIRLQTYYPRVRHKGLKYGYSAWSTGASFYAIWQLRPTVIGQLFQGGYWGGDIVLGDGATYAIVVAPKAVGEKQLKLVGNLINTPGAASTLDSVANTAALAALTGTNASAAAAFVKGLSIAGYNDWVVGSKAVMTVVNTKLAANLAGAPAPYKTGGVEAWQTNYYWTSTTYDWVDSGSYETGGDPIYESRTTTSNQTRSFNDGPVGESADYSGEIRCGSGETGPNGVSGPTFHASPGVVMPWGERVGYFSASWSCGVTTTKNVLVGYTPTDTVYYSNPYYQAWLQMMTTTTSTYTNKTGSYWIRAVRLVKVAG